MNAATLKVLPERGKPSMTIDVRGTASVRRLSVRASMLASHT
jgi:hypothetical protein